MNSFLSFLCFLFIAALIIGFLDCLDSKAATVPISGTVYQKPKVKMVCKGNVCLMKVMSL